MIKKLLALILLLTTVFIGSLGGSIAEATINREVSEVELKIIEDAYEEIKSQIFDDYGELYDLYDFSYEYSLSENRDRIYVDIDVFTKMKLKRHPKDSPFVKGVEEALNEEKNRIKVEELKNSMTQYIDEIEQLYYDIPNNSTFTYAIELPNKFEVQSIDNGERYKIFYRTDSEENRILTDSKKLKKVEDKEAAYKYGYNLVKNCEPKFAAEANDIQMKSSIFYDRIEARDWARDNAYETPEYPSAQVNGTDCANFVSKAVNAGGIPQDTHGKWYSASTWGGWPGDNWFRTGYNGKTGVVIYMKDKGYFYKEHSENKVFAGSIMYWNNTSHVALVTYGDGVTIKYTQHGARQTKDTVYRTEDATFYMPSSSITD